MPDNQFIETGFSYDLNSNIKALKRYDKGILKDSYNYNYLGNQLLAIYVRPVSSRNAVPQSVDFAAAVPVIPRDTIYNGVGYVYDSAGNVLYDSHAGLNLRYNDLNLIEKVMRGDTIVAKYSYLSDGTKFSATDSAGNGLYYSGSLIYTKHGAALTMESCAFTGGRFVATATGVEARYFVTDHLGSVRAVVNGDGEVLEHNDYYPFGSRWDDGLLSDNRYRYNGKEAQAFLNNPYLDYGARQYDSDGAVWLGKDPLSEKYYPISPYSFCANNPIKFVDSDGRDIKIWYKDNNGLSRSYVYSGGSVTVANKFVNQVVEAYQYNKRNTGGDNPMTKAVEGNVMINIMQTDGPNGYRSAFNTIDWNPELGLETETTVLSPATSADHEFDHGLDDIASPDEHAKRASTPDAQYDTKEERRVITGSEQKTAKANGEIKGNLPTRRNHKGRDVITTGVTSSVIDPTKTQAYEKRQKEIRDDSSIQWGNF